VSEVTTSVGSVRRLTYDELRRRTLRRQFPPIRGRGPEAVVELFRRLGPIQSQVPRAPFLTISSRLPGVSYQTVCRLFESHQLVKTSNIRGTVHTSVVEQFAWLDAVARDQRARQVRNVLKLQRVTPEQLAAEIERRSLLKTGKPGPRLCRMREPGWLTARQTKLAIPLINFPTA
jgi:hypothetical protein